MSKELDLIFGAGGDEPDKPTRTDDNLFSEDIVEFALAISEGPIRGLHRGAKDFMVGDTPLVSESGARNFEKFAIGVHPGYNEDTAQVLDLKLGGISSNNQVGVLLTQNVAVTRQTDSVLRNTIDQLEVRIYFQRLLRIDDRGGTFNNNASFKIEYKKTTDVTWTPFYSNYVIGDLWVDKVTQSVYTYTSNNTWTLLKLGGVVATANSTGTDQLWNYILGTTASPLHIERGVGTPSSSIPLNAIWIDTSGAKTAYKHNGTTWIALATQAQTTSATGPWNGTTFWEGVFGTKVSNIITFKDAQPNTAIVTVNGKTTNGYARDFAINVPRITGADWEIRVTKLSSDNSETDVVVMTWESFQSTTTVKQKFPDTAIVHGIGVSNGQFSSLPQFSGVYDGVIVRVPSNYNPDARTYDETTPWDGSFKFAWTNNPAWLLYNLIVNTRYGLAAFYPYVDANRFDFYSAGKWCDELVENGSPSTMAPRFTFNSVVSEPRSALEMLNFVAGSFNALVYDDLSGKIHLKVDRDSVAATVFTPENIEKNGFNYTYTDATTRYNDISVTFINPNLDWNEDRRRIPGVTTDEASIAKFGRIPYDFIAVGCTDEYEAIRRAQYRLLTAQTEKTIVSFTTTRIGTLLRLFDVILVSDPVMGWALPGRIHDYDAQYINLRDPIYIEENIPYVMKVQTTNGTVDVGVTVESIGYVSRLVLAGSMPTGVPEYAVFTLEGAGGLGYCKPFRVTSIEEVQGSPYAYQISGIEINRQKYFIGDSVAALPSFSYSTKQPTLPSEPRNLIATSGNDQAILTPSGTVIDRIFLTWSPGGINNGVTSYEVRWKISTDEEFQNAVTTSESLYISSVHQGESYDLQVRSVSGTVTKSRWISLTYTVAARTFVPPVLFNLQVTGQLFQNSLTWEYGASVDYDRCEIWGGSSVVTSSFAKLSDIIFPQRNWTHLGLGVGQTFYYRVRGISKTNQPTAWTATSSATTSSTPGPILDILNNQISTTQLTQSLKDTIDAAGAGAEQAVVGVQTQVDGLKAQYTVKIQANGFVTGYGLATTAVDGTPSSSFVVLANNFAFALPGATTRYPFIAGLVNGVSTVGVNGALVVDGTITASAIDTRNLTVKDAAGNVIFGSGTKLDVANMAGLGSLATANTVGVGSVTGLGGFATLNQITGSNVSTYIADAAIPRAKIGSLHVRTADIDDLQVGSLQIKNQSVIVPGSAQVLSTIRAPYTAITSEIMEAEILQVVMSLDSDFVSNPNSRLSIFAKSIMVVGVIDFGGGSGAVQIPWAELRLYRRLGSSGAWTLIDNQRRESVDAPSRGATMWTYGHESFINIQLVDTPSTAGQYTYSLRFAGEYSYDQYLYTEAKRSAITIIGSTGK